MTNIPQDPNPIDDLHTAIAGRLRDALYASETMLRNRLMRPIPPPTPTMIAEPSSGTRASTSSAASESVNPHAEHLEGHALRARGASDDPATLTVDEAVQGDQQWDVYWQMAASHRATFPRVGPGSSSRVAVNKTSRPVPVAANRLVARR